MCRSKNGAEENTFSRVRNKYHQIAMNNKQIYILYERIAFVVPNFQFLNLNQNVLFGLRETTDSMRRSGYGLFFLFIYRHIFV